MTWVKQHRRGGFVYRSVRERGRVRSVYLGPEGEYRTWEEAEFWADDDRRRRAEAREAKAEAVRKLRKRFAELDALAGGDDLRAVAGGLLALLGFHRPKRGGWRTMRRSPVGKLLDQMRGVGAGLDKLEAARKRGPLLKLTATPTDPEMVALFESARSGDPAAMARLPGYIRERRLADRLGDLGAFATGTLVGRAAGDDPVMRAGVEAKAAQMWAELAGPDPTPLERLLVRRCVNGWLGVHVAELNHSYAADPKEREAWDRHLSRSQRRLAEAVRELAVLRRLEAPVAFRRAEAVLTAAPPAALPPSER